MGRGEGIFYRDHSVAAPTAVVETVGNDSFMCGDTGNGLARSEIGKSASDL
jgi:hypothetical protein